MTNTAQCVSIYNENKIVASSGSIVGGTHETDLAAQSSNPDTARQ